MIFGGGNLQQYLLKNARKKKLRTIVIDPDEKAFCRGKADVFKVVGGQDFEETLNVAKEFNVNGLITTSTDKPLVMMARVAKELKLPFYSVDTAINSTDKLRMKMIFIRNRIPCALGVEIRKASDYLGNFPVIVKPRDNSGSRGVFFCDDKAELENIFDEVMSFTKKDTVLVEEFIEGREFSIESLHHHGEHIVLQFTEKTTTHFPYNVELEHKQPADLNNGMKDKIRQIISKIGISFGFENCASHTELKITSLGEIKIIETSPRLGGDFITSHLVPLSTGINMESLLLDIAVGNSISSSERVDKASMAYFFHFHPGSLNVDLKRRLKILKTIKGVVDFEFSLRDGENIPIIKNSLDRYGHIIFQAENKEKLLKMKKEILELF